MKTYRRPLVVASAEEVGKYRERETTAVARMRAGFVNNPPHWQPAVERALARAAAPQAPGPLDVDAEAVLVALEVCPLFAEQAGPAHWSARTASTPATRTQAGRPARGRGRLGAAALIVSIHAPENTREVARVAEQAVVLAARGLVLGR